MNGAAIPAILYYFLSFHAEIPAEPLNWIGPLTKEECIQMKKETSGGWCQKINLREHIKEMEHEGH